MIERHAELRSLEQGLVCRIPLLVQEESVEFLHDDGELGAVTVLQSEWIWLEDVVEPAERALVVRQVENHVRGEETRSSRPVPGARGPW